MGRKFTAGNDAVVEVSDRMTGEVVLQQSFQPGDLVDLGKYGDPADLVIDMIGNFIPRGHSHGRWTDQFHPHAGDTAAVQTYMPSPAVQQERMIQAVADRVLKAQKMERIRKADAARVAVPLPGISSDELEAEAQRVKDQTKRGPGEGKLKLGQERDDLRQVDQVVENADASGTDAVE